MPAHISLHIAGIHYYIYPIEVVRQGQTASKLVRMPKPWAITEKQSGQIRVEKGVVGQYGPRDEEWPWQTESGVWDAICWTVLI